MTTQRSSAAKDPLAPYERGAPGNTLADQAIAIVNQFLASLGYPKGVDPTNLDLSLLTTGFVNSPERAYNYLFTRITKAEQLAHPNAEFGMSYDTYVTQSNAIKDSFEFYTGMTSVPADVMRMSIDQGWTPSEMLDFLQKDSRYTDPQQMPWLSQGMGFRDVKNQFLQTFGKAPTDSKQLASWFNFKTGAAQVSGATPAITAGLTPPVKTPSQSETR